MREAIKGTADAGASRVGQQRALKTLILVAGGQLAMSAIFVVVFAWQFPPLGRRFQLFHISLVAVLLLMVGLVVGVLTRLHGLRARWVRRMVSGLFGAASAFLILLYGADIASNWMWRENIHADMVRDYGLWALGIGRAFSPFSPWVYVSVLGGGGVVIGLFVLLSDRLFAGVESLVHPHGHYSLFGDPRRTRPSLAVLGVCFVALVIELGWLTTFLLGAGLLHRDPIIGFFRPQAEGRFGWYLTFEDQQRRVARERDAYQQHRQTADRNVVLIIVDSLRADHLPVYGYARQTAPFLWRLTHEGRLRKVELAFSSCALTTCGILSTMSGKYVPRLQADFKIFDLLHDLGYKSYFVLGGHHDREGLRLAYGREQALYLDAGDAGRHNAQDDRNVLEGLTRLPRNTNDKAFVYIHLMSAHWAGTKWPEYTRFVPSDARIGLGTVFRGPAEREKWVNRYDNGVLQADAVIERVFATLEGLGYLETSTVFILGDHGEALGEHGPTSYFHGNILYQEAVRIPLLIYDDAGVQYQNLEFASQIDVAPTIADRLNLEVPRSWRGVSLLRPIEDRAVVIGDAGCGSVAYRHTGQTLKYVRCGNARAEALYDLASDPAETQNLIKGADPQLVQLLRATLDRGE